MPSPIAAAARPWQPAGPRGRRIETNQCAVGPATSTVMARPPRRRGLDRERHLADDAAAADHMVSAPIHEGGRRPALALTTHVARWERQLRLQCLASLGPGVGATAPSTSS